MINTDGIAKEGSGRIALVGTLVLCGLLYGWCFRMISLFAQRFLIKARENGPGQKIAQFPAIQQLPEYFVTDRLVTEGHRQ